MSDEDDANFVQSYRFESECCQCLTKGLKGSVLECPECGGTAFLTRAIECDPPPPKSELDRYVDELVGVCMAKPVREQVRAAILAAYCRGIGVTMRAVGRWPANDTLLREVERQRNQIKLANAVQALCSANTGDNDVE